MELPKILSAQIAQLTASVKTESLKQAATGLSKRYRQAAADGRSLLDGERDVLSYAAVRMPATYGAVYDALQKVLAVTDVTPKTMVDAGAGTGAAGWAADAQINLRQMVCLEREKAMADLGQFLMRGSDSHVLKNAEWRGFDLVHDEIAAPADLVTAAYVLNELDEISRIAVVDKLWRATEQVLLIIEPGTPKAFESLLQIRRQLINDGAYLLAPCPHDRDCPLSESDWCHFSCRIARSRLHRQLKAGALGYEDEKYCFAAFGRQPRQTVYERVLKEPNAAKAEIRVETCCPDGTVATKVFGVRDKAVFKKAKKICWGDELT